jgi:hypothetical protein
MADTPKDETKATAPKQGQGKKAENPQQDVAEGMEGAKLGKSGERPRTIGNAEEMGQPIEE